MIKKDDKAVRKPKGKRAQETQMLVGVPKSQEKVITKIKWVCSSKAMKNKKRGGKSKKSGKRKYEWRQMSNYWSWSSVFETLKHSLSLISFSFITENHSLRYVPIEVLSNQASKQPRTINNALKMQRTLFHKIHDIKNKLLIIIHADKNKCSKRDKFFFLPNLELFLESFTSK